jgi:hypothetical protein
MISVHPDYKVILEKGYAACTERGSCGSWVRREVCGDEVKMISVHSNL